MIKEALKQVSSLIDRFRQNSEAYRSPAYNETQLRIEFIDPFFEALGWDINLNDAKTPWRIPSPSPLPHCGGEGWGEGAKVTQGEIQQCSAVCLRGQ